MMNFDQKSNLAKLLATENVEVQHNNVKTASFNLVDRILTIPVFKNPKGAVYDMLIAHEVSHALHTPQKEWQKCLEGEDNLLEIKDYINIIEDIRIDKMIQKKYPGVVQDYLDGFKILWNDDFFGARDKNLDTELQLADKINLYYKSSKTLPFDFDNAEMLFVNMVNECVTFADVIEAAKKLAQWQKEQNKKLQKLPDFDSHPLTLQYGEKEEKKEDNEENEGDNQSQKSDNQSSQSDKETKSGEDTQNEQTQSDDSKKEDGNGSKQSEDGKEKSKSDGVEENQTGNPDGAGGEDVKINMPLKSITQNNVDKKMSENYIDNKAAGFAYMNIPEANIKDIVISPKEWIEDGFKSVREYGQQVYNSNYQEFKDFKKESARTISYLVKEFEMKKSADGYKRQTTDKTGIIDPLKLHKYKISEDIFKRLSVIPDAKNHGMILLLDWSGSMSNSIGKTIDQLLQLVWFCQRIGIPYKVYFFIDPIDDNKDYSWSSRRGLAKEKARKCFNIKSGDSDFKGFNLVEVANHSMKKQDLEKSLFLLFAFGKYYSDNYGYGRRRYDEYKERISPPRHFYLSSTPLNEALASMYKIVPMFRQKYQVDKMSLITLTDGHSNDSNKSVYRTAEDGTLQVDERGSYSRKPVLRLGKKELSMKGQFYSREETTALLLEGLRRKFRITTIGFFLIQNSRRYEFERYALSDSQRDLPYSLREELLSKIRKEFTKNKSASVKADGYNEFFLINAKTMKVENSNLDELKETSKKGDIKRIFGKSMKSRTVSRVLLSKFIKQVA